MDTEGTRYKLPVQVCDRAAWHEHNPETYYVQLIGGETVLVDDVVHLDVTENAVVLLRRCAEPASFPRSVVYFAGSSADAAPPLC